MSDEFALLLKSVSSVKSVVSIFLLSINVLHKNTSNLAEVAYEDAKRFANEGLYDKALECHLWFHEHALEYEPAFYGVRLSFALSSWLELGKKYPPALTALMAVRDRSSTKLYHGDPCDDLFHDVVALNNILGADDATFTMFEYFEKIDPTLASRRFRFLIDLAFKSAPNLFMKYVHDLEAYFETICEIHVSMNQSFHQSMITFSKSYPNDVAARKTRFKRFDQKFQKTAAKLGEMAVSRGQQDVATRISNRVTSVQIEIESLMS